MFATACGSPASVDSQASDAIDIPASEAPSADVESDVEADGSPEPDVATSPVQEDAADAAEAADDPLFFGEYASLDGPTVDLADYAGQDVVLWFWAPW